MLAEKKQLLISRVDKGAMRARKQENPTATCHFRRHWANRRSQLAFPVRAIWRELAHSLHLSRHRADPMYPRIGQVVGHHRQAGQLLRVLQEGVCEVA